MTSQAYFAIILTVIVFNFIIERFLDYLNDKNRSSELPKELEGIYDKEKYKKSQDYQKEKSRISFIGSFFSLGLVMSMLLLDGFAWLDSFVQSRTDNPILSSILFFAIIAIVSDVISLPFSIYNTFKIEEKYGFNKTTVPLFIIDKIKGYLLGALLGGTILYFLIQFYESAPDQFWLYAWLLIVAFMLLMNMFYTSLIMPLFNKLTPLPEGDLKNEVNKYAEKTGYDLSQVYVIDGSKRSNKANAFFSGFGSRKKVVLYDTLIKNHTTEELVAVLAHEVGHYKKKHIIQSLIMGILQTGIMLFVLQLFLKDAELAKALGVNQPSFHIGIVAFSFIFSPISQLTGIFSNIISRKNEYEADAYAKKTYDGKPLQDALKKLSVDNLSNLQPHPWYEFFYYSHPTLLKRLKALDN